MNGQPPDFVDADWTLEEARAFAAIVIAAQTALLAGRERWLWRRVAALAGAAVTSLLAFLATSSPAMATGGAILGYLLVVAGMWAHHWSQGSGSPIDAIYEKDPLSYQPRRFEVTPTGLIERRDGIVGEVAWERLVRAAPASSSSGCPRSTARPFRSAASARRCRPTPSTPC